MYKNKYFFMNGFQPIHDKGARNRPAVNVFSVAYLKSKPQRLRK